MEGLGFRSIIQISRKCAVIGIYIYLNKVVFIQQLIIQYLVCKDLSFEYISRDQFAYKISIRSNTGK